MTNVVQPTPICPTFSSDPDVSTERRATNHYVTHYDEVWGMSNFTNALADMFIASIAQASLPFAWAAALYSEISSSMRTWSVTRNSSVAP
jgi:hypothetical protein